MKEINTRLQQARKKNYILEEHSVLMIAQVCVSMTVVSTQKVKKT